MATEPAASIIFVSRSDGLELAHEEVGIVGELLVAWSGQPFIRLSSFDWPLLLGVKKADLHHLAELNDVIFVDRRLVELLILAGLYPLVDLPLQHDRYVVRVMRPEWLAWTRWIGSNIMGPEVVVELEGVLSRCSWM